MKYNSNKFTFLKYLIVFYIIIAQPHRSIAQIELKGSVDKLHLKKGNYFITKKLFVFDSLIVDPGVKIFFHDNTSITINGHASFNGNISERIILAGIDSLNSEGLIIKGNIYKNINFGFVHFENLKSPINFLNDWYRPKVEIQNCEFIKNSNSSFYLINILNPVLNDDFSYNKSKIIIKENLFAENKAAIYLEDFQSPGLTIELLNNIFCENVIMGSSYYNYNTNIIFGRFDKHEEKEESIIRDNAFVNNYLINEETDSLCQSNNIGIYGSADSLVIYGNYFEDKNSIYDNLINYNSPRIVNKNDGDKLINNPPFIKKINFVSEDINKKFNNIKRVNTITFETNKPINTQNMKILIHIFSNKNSSKNTLSVKYRISNLELNKYKVEINSDSLAENSIFYYSISNLEGINKEYIPEIKINYIAFKINFKNTIKEKREETLGVSTKTKNTFPPERIMKRHYEIGILTGFAIYNGTISNSSILKNDINSSFGIVFKTILNKKYSLNINFQSFTLSGSDLNSEDTFKIKRSMNFKSPTLSTSIIINRDFNNNLTFKKNKLIPSIGIGMELIKFNPMSKYNGIWYDLQPLGTAGQYLPNSKIKPYPLFTFGSVISAEINFLKNEKISVSANLSYHFTFTQYLDDVGPDIYPNISDLINLGGSNNSALVYFSNPSGFNRTNQIRSGTINSNDNFVSLNFKLAKIF
jgi:hypothetical protein